MVKMTLEKVGPENLSNCGIGCLTNQKHQGYQPKLDWLKERFAEGLRFFLFRDEKGKPLAFLEYMPGEYAWRPVDAAGWLFVHCLWVYPSGQKVGGLGSLLIQACLEEASQALATGVAAMVSDGVWMAGKDIFFKNGFTQVAEADRFQLVLHVLYSNQCPMLPKSVTDISEMAAENGLELKVTLLNSAREAQNAPSYYGVFNLLWNGRLLSDHYVSKGRFKNLLRKEIFKEKD
jgi:hypothetical protein